MKPITKKTLRLDKHKTLEETTANSVEMPIREQMGTEILVPTEAVVGPIQAVVESKIRSKLQRRTDRSRRSHLREL